MHTNNQDLKTLPHGLFIAIEGIDGAGKSGLAQKLLQNFTNMGLKSIITREPGGTEFGNNIRAILHKDSYKIDPKAEFLLFASDRAQHFYEVVKPNLHAGNIVISDRTADSSLAYQGYGRGLNKDLINTVNTWVMDGILADITLYLKIDYRLARKRIEDRNNKLTPFEQEENLFFERVIQGFEDIFKDRKNVITLDASLKIEELENQALDGIFKYFKSHKSNNTCHQNCCC